MPRHKMVLHIEHMGGGRMLPSMLGKIISIISPDQAQL
jgi:hypothetical protein